MNLEGRSPITNHTSVNEFFGFFYLIFWWYLPQLIYLGFELLNMFKGKETSLHQITVFIFETFFHRQVFILSFTGWIYEYQICVNLDASIHTVTLMPSLLTKNTILHEQETHRLLHDSYISFFFLHLGNWIILIMTWKLISHNALFCASIYTVYFSIRSNQLPVQVI